MSSQAQAPSTKYKWVYHKQTATSIYLKWDKPASQESFEYDIKYRKENEKMFTVQSTSDNEITLYDLASDVVYIIKAFFLNDEGDSIQMFNTVCRTNTSHLPKILQESTLIHGCNKPHIYKLPCIVHESDTDYFKQCHIFSKQPYDAKEKTILVVGVSGWGKSTFINGMINYIAGVSFHDEFRFKMVDPTNIDEPHKCKKDLSQLTTATTCYKIPRREEFSIDFPLNIIDTPGFGYPCGQSDDENIPLQIKKVLESVHSLHSVCIVIPSCLRRITTETQRVFNSILQVLGLFDVNIKNIIHLCLTFDDGGDPTTCLSIVATAGIPFEKYFRFNNGALFKLEYEELNEIFKRNWCDSRKAFKDLFSEIGNISPQCLQTKF